MSHDTLDRLRTANIRRHQEWANGKDLPLAFRGVELAGEAGEACNEIKKLCRKELGLRGEKDGFNDLADELADVMICCDLIAMDLGIDLKSAIAEKFNRTSRKHGLETMFAQAECPSELS